MALTMEKAGRDLERQLRENARLQKDREQILMTLDYDDRAEALRKNNAERRALRREAGEEYREAFFRAE